MSADRMYAEEANYVWLQVLGIPIRRADLRVIDLLGGGSRAVADYIWDHWLGEPRKPTREDVYQQVLIARKAFVEYAYPEHRLKKERTYGRTRASRSRSRSDDSVDD